MHRFRRPIALLAASLVIAAGTRAAAQPAGPAGTPPAGEKAAAPDKPPSKAKRAAVRHFKNGVKLYQDKNYKGALAEFEAAYRLKPGASSLQNVALCLKALFRYSEAADTLEKLLQKHGSEIDDQERAEVEAAIDELSSLVGSVHIQVEPPGARVSVDGREISRKAREKDIRLDVGEHTVTASAPGYASVSQVVRVAGGQKHIPVGIALTPTMGFVTVEIDDPDAAIAIDGKAEAFSHFSGPLTPGQHYVQVYKKGFKPFEKRFTVEVGQKQTIDATLGPPVAPENSGAKDNGSKEKPSRQLRGWYAMGSLDLTGLTGDPNDTKQPSGHATGGAALGVRAGYRLWTPVAIELLMQGGRHDAKDQCVPNCDADPHATRDYTVESFRIGPNLRINSGGEIIRFTSALGLGAVQHKVTFKDITANGVDVSTVPPKDTVASGWDPYLLLEIGVQFNLGHVLLEADAVADIDQASSIHYGTTYPYRDADGTGKGGVRMLGIGLRAGWSEWAPPTKVSKITQLTR